MLHTVYDFAFDNSELKTGQSWTRCAGEWALWQKVQLKYHRQSKILSRESWIPRKWNYGYHHSHKITKCLEIIQRYSIEQYLGGNQCKCTVLPASLNYLNSISRGGRQYHSKWINFPIISHTLIMQDSVLCETRQKGCGRRRMRQELEDLFGEEI